MREIFKGGIFLMMANDWKRIFGVVVLNCGKSGVEGWIFLMEVVYFEEGARFGIFR